MKIAVVGATGMVGQVMLQVLAERKLAITELLLVASSKNKGKEMEWEGRKYLVKDLAEAVLKVHGEIARPIESIKESKLDSFNVVNIEKVRKFYNWAPKIKLEESIKELM